MRYYVTYKFYDEKGRRLAIFAIPGYKLVDNGKNEGELEQEILRIYVITCSKKDTFSKKRARHMFAEFYGMKQQGWIGASAHPIELQIDIKDDKPKFTFLKWCEENYAKYIPTVFAIEAPMLYRGDELVDGRFDHFDIVPIEDADKIPQTTSEN